VHSGFANGTTMETIERFGLGNGPTHVYDVELWGSSCEHIHAVQQCQHTHLPYMLP
jgi:hypothetical protein